MVANAKRIEERVFREQSDNAKKNYHSKLWGKNKKCCPINYMSGDGQNESINEEIYDEGDPDISD